jgi:hypothetical protein
MEGRTLVSCGQCGARFPSEADVETHMTSTHGAAETRFGRNTQARMDEDIEAIFGDPDDDDSDDDSEDEPDGEYQSFLEEVRALREASLPLAQKVRPGRQQSSGRASAAPGGPGQRIKRWPQLKLEAAKFAINNFGEKSKMVKAWGTNAKEAKNNFNSFALWPNLLRRVEGRFGSGVYSYFKFLKWSMGLNLVMVLLTFAFIVLPQLVLINDNAAELYENCTSLSVVPAGYQNSTKTKWFPKEDATACCGKEWRLDQAGKRDLGQWPPLNATQFFDIAKKALLGLLMGNEWIEDTTLYYGSYREDNVGYYQSNIAYFFVIFACLVFSMVQIVRSSAHSFKRSFKWNQFNSSQYFDLVFCSWDLSLSTKDSVHIKQMGLINEVLTALSTDKVQAQYDNMSTAGKIFRSFKRLLAWLTVLAVYAGFIFVIYRAYQKALELSSSSELCPEIDISSVKSFACNFYDYLMPFTITSLNLLIPFLFSYIIQYEEYDPKVKLVIDLGRSIFLRLISLLVAVILVIIENDCEYKTVSVGDIDVQACNNEEIFIAMDISSVDKSECPRQMCWETGVGSSFYALTLMDMLIQVGMMLLVDIPRAKLPFMPAAVSTIEFNIPKHVLDIVYTQTICWMGLFFSPLISLITFIKLFVLFYLRIAYLRFLCTPSSSLYEASKMSSIMKMFLLISFACSLFPLAYIISQLSPSNACGPFRGLPDLGSTFYGGVVEFLIHGWEATPGRNFLYFFGRLEVLTCLTGALLLATYLQYTVGAARGAYNSRIEEELRRVGEEKRRLTAEVDRAIGRVTNYL